MEENKKKNKKVIIGLMTSLLILVAIIGTMSFIVYKNYEEKLKKDNVEITKSIQERYDILNNKIKLLILNEEEETELTTKLEDIKKLIEEEKLTEEINNIIDSVNAKVEEIKVHNIELLTEKENELNGISIEKFNEEQKNKVTELQGKYEELKNQNNYKEAQRKIQECIDYKNNTNTEITKAEETEAERLKQEQANKTTQNKPSTPNTPSTPSTPSTPIRPTSLNLKLNNISYDVQPTPPGGYRIRIRGTVTNNANWNLKLVYINWKVYSADGQVVCNVNKDIYGIRAGETQVIDQACLFSTIGADDSSFTYKVFYDYYEYE